MELHERETLAHTILEYGQVGAIELLKRKGLSWEQITRIFDEVYTEGREYLDALEKAIDRVVNK